jgi:PiT family inorganic phosphate transporter
MYELAIGAILAALFFDFINGFHDAANSIATVVGTRILKPIQAVSLAAAANFVGPFLFGVAVATTVGKGIINPDFVTIHIVIGALVGAIIWNLITWIWGFPSSSSHALIGGIIGSGIAGVGTHAILFDGLQKVAIGIVVSPVVGFIVAFGCLWKTTASIIYLFFANPWCKRWTKNNGNYCTYFAQRGNYNKL